MLSGPGLIYCFSFTGDLYVAFKSYYILPKEQVIVVRSAAQVKA